MEDAVNHPTAGLSLRPNAGKASEGAAAVAERSVRVGAGDDEAELFFLIADFLKRRSACQNAASALVDELAAHRLLGEGVDWRGQRKVATYEDYRLRHRDIRPGHLMELLRNVAGRDQVNGSSSGVSSSSSGDRPAPEAVTTSTSLLLKSRVDATTHVELSEEERMQLAKQIVSQLSALRRNLKTQQVVQQVISKYERLQQYTNVQDARLLPADLLTLMFTTETDKVTALAADVRALKQLFQLRKERDALESDIRELTERASRAHVFKSIGRTGRNQMSRLQRREVSSKRVPTLPPAYVYSRIRRLKTLNGHLQIQTYCLTYDKTGKFVITGADDRLIKIWSLETGDLKFTLRGHVGNITDLAVNNSNTLLASSSDDKTVRVWELSTGAPVAVLLGHSSIVNSVRFHPKKNVVVTASDDGRCFCYILPEIPRVNEPETRLQTAKRLFGLKAYLLSLHPMYSLSHGLRQGSRSNKVLCLSFSRCGNYVVTGGEDGIARVWDMSILSDPHAPVVVPRYQPTDEPGERVLEPDTTVNIRQAIDGANIAGLVGLEANLPQPFPVDPLRQEVQPQQQLQLDGVEPDMFPGLTALQQPQVPMIPTIDPQQAIPFVLTPAPAAMPAAALPPVAPSEVPTPEPGQVPAQAAPLVPAAAVAVPQQPQLPQLPQGGISSVTVADSDVPRLPNSEPIALLKGHSGPITNIIFSHVGDQVATASIKDGSTRIWKVTKNYQRMKSIVLEPEKPDDDEAFARMYGVHTRRKARPAVDTLMWTRDDQRLISLHSVKPGTHSVDDDWRQRIKVWNPSNGNLVMTLGAIDPAKQNGHINAVFAMDVHPTDWRILVTAGYDGRVFLWDISTGRMLKSFVNMSPEFKAVPMLDGGFMPDGNGFCFTDQIGRLLIFGTGSGEKYAAAPVQQYFRRDYAVLVTDRNMNVQDRETHQLPSLMDSGPLVDIYRIEYPHQPPHLLPNGAALTREEYEENRRQRIEQTKESEIKCRVRHLPEEEEEITTFPLAICRLARKHTREEALNEAIGADAVAGASFRLNGAPVTLSELRRRPNLIGARRIDRLQRRRSSASLEERDTSILEMEISSDDDHSDEDFQAPARNAANDGDEDEEEEDDEDEDEDDEMDEDDLLSDNEDAVVSPSNFRRRRLRSARSPTAGSSRRFPRRGGRRLVEEGEDGEAGATRQLRGRRLRRPVVDIEQSEFPEEDARDGMGSVERDDDSLSRSSPERMSGGDIVVVESNDGFIMGDNQLDKFDRNMTYDEILEAKQRQLGTSRENAAANGEEPLISCAFCNEGDDGGLLKLPGDSMGVHPLINGSQRLFVHDQCAIASPLCFKRNGNWYNVTKEIRRGRSLTCVECKKRGATVGCAIPSCPKSYHWKCAVNCGWSLNQMQFYCPTHESQRSNSGRSRGADSPSSSESDAEPVARRFGLAYHREWLQLVNLRAIHQYVPQVGDYVTYFPEGHLAYLRYCEMRNPSFFARLSKFYAVKCRVLDVKYKFPLVAEYAKCSTIKCEISLAVLAVPASQVPFANQEGEESKQEDAIEPHSRGLFDGDHSLFANFASVDQALRPTESDANAAGSTTSTSPRFQFKMVYYSNDVANFLVLDHVYDNGVRGGWEAGDRVKMPYVQLDSFGLETGSKMSFGVIKSIAPKEAMGSSGPTVSPWECIIVDWESEEDETCAVSPWELEFADSDRQREKRQREIARPTPKLFLSRLISAEKRDVLMQVVDQITSLSISRDFIYPVDESFLDYLITVPNPIDLTKIRQRLRLGYYRQVEAFIADAKLLYINCETYNIQSSSIAQNSRSLYSSLLTEAQRHFPHLMADSNQAPSTPSELTFPPDDYVSTFPFESEEDQMVHLNVDVSEATYSDPVIEQQHDENTATPLMDTAAASTSSAEPTDVDNDPAQATPSPSRRVLRNSAQRNGGDSDVSQYQSPTRALQSPPASTGRAGTRSTALRPGPSPSVALESPESVLSPSRGSRLRRAARVVTTPVAPADAKPTRKRQRDAPEQEVVTYDGLLEKLTSAQREVFDGACADDLGMVLQDFHEALMQADEYSVFASPVTEEIAPQYFDIISTPMDFGTMLEQLAQYGTFQEYYDDVHLVFSNAVTYNTWGSPIGEVVAELQKYSVKFLLDAIGANRGQAGALAARGHRRGGRNRAGATSKPSAQRANETPARARSTALGKRRARSVVSDGEENEGSWGSDYSESTANDDDDEDEEEEEEEEEEEDDADSDDSRRRPKSRAKAKAKRRRH